MSGRAKQFGEVARFLTEQAFSVAIKRPNHSATIYRSVWYADKKRLRRVSVGELFPSIVDAEVSLVSAFRESPGNVWLNELVVLAGLCRILSPKNVFEIGTFNGRTTVNLAANTTPDCLVYTLDIPHDHPVHALASGEERFMLAANGGALYRSSPFAARVRQLWADSAEFDPAPLANTIDFAFIDGSHSYDYVRNDTAKIKSMLTPGGIVLWHDYYPQYPDVARYLEEEYREKVVHIDTTSLVALLPGEHL